MTAIHVDPWLPGIDIDHARCPGCGQSLAAVIDYGPLLPARHYRWPVWPKHRPGVVRLDRSTNMPPDLLAAMCAVTGDDLARLVFIAQRGDPWLNDPDTPPDAVTTHDTP